jgi:hypothetical protein
MNNKIECIKIFDDIREICKTPQLKFSKNLEFVMDDQHKRKACILLLKKIELCINPIKSD